MDDLDLFATPAIPKKVAPRVWAVGELTRALRVLLEKEVGEIWVQGEICNYRKQASGHHYFGLKDERSVLSCVLFRGSAPARLELAEGMQVQVRGDMTVYEARGQYQLTVSLVQPAGQGLLQARFEALKRKLEVEGLFAQDHKRPLPGMPRRIGLVTSPTGAAVQDFLNIAHRRAPWVGIIINPVRVQGEGSAGEIAAAIREFNSEAFQTQWPVDVIVVCRGGGSMEDLWAFNEEVVARAIFDSAIPIVSAVGHEIDFTIADFVADLRAPTPSAAAELVVPDQAVLRRHLLQAAARMQREAGNALARWRWRYEELSRAPVFREPRRRVQQHAQDLDEAAAAMKAHIALRLRDWWKHLEEQRACVQHHRPDQLIRLSGMELGARRQALQALCENRLLACEKRLEFAAGLLRVLSPGAIMKRGFSITLDETGRPVKNAAAVKPGDPLTTQLADGIVKSRVE